MKQYKLSIVMPVIKVMFVIILMMEDMESLKSLNHYDQAHNYIDNNFRKNKRRLEL